MFVEHNLIKNIKIFTLAFTLTVVLIQLSRFISPLAIIHSSYIFLAWMPLCVMLSILPNYLMLLIVFWCKYSEKMDK